MQLSSRPSSLVLDHHQNKFLTPWSDPADPQILFPIQPLEQLLVQLGWPDPQAWLIHWQKRGGISLKRPFWHPSTRTDWIWGLGLPLLTLVEGCLGKSDRSLLGITGLPGCGKTSLGCWLEAAAGELGWPIKVISLDDFYWPFPELDRSMSGNPWRVPRALPGSHDLDLLASVLDTWQSTGHLKAPMFDKALRHGRGDRDGWHLSDPKVLVIEGWILGCLPCKFAEAGQFSDQLVPPLNKLEHEYRLVVQEALNGYVPIWDRLDTLWHLKAIDPSSTRIWKANQESLMQLNRGVCLDQESFEGFVRMILASIPLTCLDGIEADVVATLTPARQLMWVGQRGYQDSSSSDSCIG